MENVWIRSAAVAHPATRIRQDEAVVRLAETIGLPRQVEALARGSQIEGRASALPIDQIPRLGSIQERNAIYETEAPRLAQAAVDALDECLDEVSFLVSSSCTGYMVPAWTWSS